MGSVYTSDWQDAMLRVLVAFTNHEQIGSDVFVDNLTNEQYAALRDMNVLRIDSGDDRIPEDYKIEGRTLKEK